MHPFVNMLLMHAAAVPPRLHLAAEEQKAGAVLERRHTLVNICSFTGRPGCVILVCSALRTHSSGSGALLLVEAAVAAESHAS